MRRRFIRTLKEQCICTQAWEDVGELRPVVKAFPSRSNHDWLIERLGHRTPRKAYAASYGLALGPAIPDQGSRRLVGSQRFATIAKQKGSLVSRKPGPIQTMTVKKGRECCGSD